MRSRTIMQRWSVMMLGLVLVGLMLTSSSGQARVAREFGQPGANEDVERDMRDRGVEPRGGEARADRNRASSGDVFNDVVRRLRAESNLEETSPPFLWLASLAVRAARPAGVLDFRLATFEGRDLATLARDQEFAAAVRQSPGEGWTPLIQVRSRRNGELVNIQTRAHGDNVSLLLVTIDHHDAVVIQATVKPETIAKWLKEPVRIKMRAAMTE